MFGRAPVQFQEITEATTRRTVTMAAVIMNVKCSGMFNDLIAKSLLLYAAYQHLSFDRGRQRCEI